MKISEIAKIRAALTAKPQKLPTQKSEFLDSSFHATTFHELFESERLIYTKYTEVNSSPDISEEKKAEMNAFYKEQLDKKEFEKKDIHSSYREKEKDSMRHLNVKVIGGYVCVGALGLLETFLSYKILTRNVS